MPNTLPGYTSAMRADTADPTPTRPGLLTYQASTWYLLAQAGSQARHLWSGVLAQLHVSPSQFKVLRALSESGPLGQHQLANLISVDPRNAVPLIDSLAERGLLAREVDPADRRRRVLTLTPRGRAGLGRGGGRAGLPQPAEPGRAAVPAPDAAVPGTHAGTGRPRGRAG